MSKRTVVPFGPQHPVLPEPIHLDLVLEDEKVVNAIPRIGYIHRGLEKLVEKRDYTQFVYVAERICGICSFGHSLGYSQCVEQLMGVEITDRAEYLRAIFHELSRVHSHLLWLGLLADGFGFEALFMHCWRLREQILDIFEECTGGRVIFSACDVGGFRQEVSNETLRGIVVVLDRMRDEYNMRRRLVVKSFNDMGLTCFEPRGAFYVFPCIRCSGLTSQEFCEMLLKEQEVAIIPGDAFGSSGEGYARISYAYSVEHLETAMRRIRTFLKDHGWLAE